ncbi:MAG TPA: sigma-70 family RNA polymerase sigma factor [Thermomicrobiales bacterium]|nr:sigma-70 family RNA polymerase sigma factor [Thermomicrobiales bacterium]
MEGVDPVSHARHAPPELLASEADERLVERAQRGEREAFAALYDRYLPRVYGYCLRLLGSREAAEDANADVFMRALIGLPGFRAGSFRSWLFSIAHNVIIDHRRRRRRGEPLLAAIEAADPGPSPEAAAIASAERAALHAALPLLYIEQQHVVALRLAGLSAVEIGEALGKPRGAIDALQHRAVVRLRALLATGAEAATTGGG